MIFGSPSAKQRQVSIQTTHSSQTTQEDIMDQLDMDWNTPDFFVGNFEEGRNDLFSLSFGEYRIDFRSES